MDEEPFQSEWVRIQCDARDFEYRDGPRVG
jgi:hypothetical protein